MGRYEFQLVQKEQDVCLALLLKLRYASRVSLVAYKR